jgi:glycosyltransferase involved in cell wall biosynthesis
MRIGIKRSAAAVWHGGIFHYESVFLDALCEIAKNFPEEMALVAYNPDDFVRFALTGDLQYRGLPIQPLYAAPETPQQRPLDFYLAQKPVAAPPQDPNNVKFDAAAEAAFRNAGIDLLLLLSPVYQAFSYRIPFVMPIFDLNHKIHPEFPEVSAFGETQNRDYLYINGCRFATFVLVDSEVGKSDVLRFYGEFIDEDRIRVLPYYAPIVRKPMPSADDIGRVRKKYNLPARYFFYPAQFWRHKNHELIVRALRLITDETGEIVPVVFCGSYADYFRAQNVTELDALAKEFGVSDRIRYLGIVPDEDMGALYSLSTGLVMPTFFGPTNIPPLEAWHFGRAVIGSDIPGMRAQIGDAGLLVDPRSAPDLAGAMMKLWRDEALGAELVERGRRRLSSRTWDSFVQDVAAIIAEACECVRSGRTPRYPGPI